jgi:hypothetical protein
MISALWDYVSSYKVSLTIGATLAALTAAAVSAQWRYILIGFAVFFLATWAGLYPYYMVRQPVLMMGYLESFARFLNLPLRIWHLIGALALTAAIIRFDLPRVFSFLPKTAYRAAIGVAIAAGLLWQTRAVVRAADDMTDRRHQDVALITKLDRYDADLVRIVGEIERREMATPNLGVIDQKGYDTALTSAIYYSLKSHRASAGTSYRHFLPAAVHTADQIAKFDIVWPVTLDAETTAKIAATVDDPACAATPTDYILVKADSARFICLTKAGKP